MNLSEISSLPAVPVALALAFVFGLIARYAGLPPLVGFLFAGFGLNALGFESNELIKQISQLGVLLLLFTIGLKLKPKVLARPDVWTIVTIQGLAVIGIFGFALYGLGRAGMPLVSELSLESALLVGFALNFSSTVFGVKILDARSETGSLYGRTALGVLVIQDVFAVAFLSLAGTQSPSPWAFGLVGLVLLRPVLNRLLDHAGHGELVPLFGLFAAAVVGAGTFAWAGLKPDLGALVVGMLMASHRRAPEIADALFGFKELMLIGFFLDIGLSGRVNWSIFGVALVLMVLLPIKGGLFFALLTSFGLRVRSAFLAAASLFTYSEFGLIVAAGAAASGLFSGDWVTVIALATALSFFAASPFNVGPNRFYARFYPFLRRFEPKKRHPEDTPLVIGDAVVAIFGMGRVGTGTYDYFSKHRAKGEVVGIESDIDRALTHRSEGRNVIHGDATDSEFWERLHAAPHNLKAVLLAMPEHSSNLYAARQIRAGGFEGFIGALAKFPEHVDSLKEAGVHAAFNMYAEAGIGFAANVEADLAAHVSRARKPAK